MISKPVFLAGICLCFAPALAETVVAEEIQPLSIDGEARQEIPSSLQAFVRRIWSENPRLQGAGAALEAARARVEASTNPLHNPVLKLDVEKTGVQTSSLGLTQTIDWSNKQGALREIAGRELALAQAEWRLERQRLAAQTLEALVRHATQREMYELSRVRSRLMKSFVDTVSRRRAAGDVSAADLMLARVAYSEALIAQTGSLPNKRSSYLNKVWQAARDHGLSIWEPIQRAAQPF